MIALTEKDNGSPVTVDKGEHVQITLAWKPSSGYFWQNSDTSAGDLIQVKHEGTDDKPGAVSYVTFLFRITKEGIVTLNYARPWSELDPPAKWFTVVVKLKEAL